MSRTKEKILQKALAQFNKQGTRVVTTNHIARACGMSPGNLYYHYENKEAIIFALFERMIAAWDKEVLNVANCSPRDILSAQLKKTFRYVWEYRFIHRELATLLNKNPALKKLCNQVLLKRCREIKALVMAFESMEVLRPLSDTEREFIAKTALFYGLFWQPYLEVTGGVINKKSVLQGVDMIRTLLLPYLMEGVRI